MSSHVTLSPEQVAEAVANASADRPPWKARLANAWQWIEGWIEKAGDYLNPILVKETRQALKSRQFTLSFVLVLVACWVVTIGGVAIVGPSIYYAAAGGEMLQAYYAVLAFPLAVIVPFMAFRSLAAEREDNTYDLLSISTLTPRQIISGKLGSAVVQMAVYLSAVAPCLAFTYLLRGVDVLTIGLLLIYAFLGSLGLSMVGLLWGALARQRFGQMLLSVVFVAALLGTFQTSFFVAMGLVQEGYVVLSERWFWISNLAVLTAYVTTFALCYCAAAALITFSSENRSTPLRLVTLLQQACAVGWFTFVWIEADFHLEVIAVFSVFAGIYWFFAGSLLTGESPEMSHRVRRSLPQSTLGRVLFTWLNPGPGTGYLFVAANVATLVLLYAVAIFITQQVRGPAAGWPGASQLLCFLVVGSSYIIAYLGIGKLVITMLRRVAEVTLLGCFLIHFLLVLGGSGIPYVVQMTSSNLRLQDYTFWQLPNPLWTLVYVLNSAGLPAETRVIVTVVPALALCVLLMNLKSLLDETRRVRVALPVRVVEDEAELHPEPPPRPASPWD